ncbi:hypothetical protein [Vibrio furnissii]|uniref:hypothetical protein n=1 Tax=Vibrio furnissii TaxID=29494 RepID=UPI001558AF46|nr:hypothetical protein [Vibrio furnissii]
MTSHSQRGVATLLLTSILLSVALVVTLGMYKHLFFQIKRAQNEVKAKQQFWRAEGGLECVYSLTQTQHALPSATSYADCPDVAFGYHTPAPGQLAVTATYGYSQLSKTIRYPASASGVLKATSNLYFAGGLSMLADPGLSLGGNQWACTMLRYSKEFYVNGALHNLGLSDSHLPYSGFPTGQSCHGEYVTTTTTEYATPVGLEKDFVNDLYQTPFEDLFGQARSEWYKVMSNPQFSKISAISLFNTSGALLSQTSLPTPAPITNCGKQIAQQIQQGKDLLWVYGSCHLHHSDLTAISGAINAAGPAIDGVILVIHNGLLSTEGTLNFKGMIYHFISQAADGTPDFVPSETQWQTLNPTQAKLLKSAVDHTSDILPAVSIDNTSYFQTGAFFPTGGYVMDAPDTYAVFTATLNFTFNRDAIEVPLNKIRQFKWQQGSWYGQ